MSGSSGCRGFAGVLSLPTTSGSEAADWDHDATFPARKVCVGRCLPLETLLLDPCPCRKLNSDYRPVTTTKPRASIQIAHGPADERRAVARGQPVPPRDPNTVSYTHLTL